MKKFLQKFLVVAMALVMTTSGAFAWSSYQGDDATHNGRITDKAVPTSSANVVAKKLPCNGSGWSGVDSAPVMYQASYTNAAGTTSTKTLAYVLYNAYSNGGTLACYDCEAGENLWTIQLSTGNTFQLSTPYLDEANHVIYAASAGNVYKISGINTANPTKEQIFTGTSTAQINTPINKYGNYLYFGTWVSNGTIDGANDPGSYYQLNLTPSNGKYSYKSYMSQYHGFYWAGATRVTVGSKNYIVFGGDDGYLYHCDESNFDGNNGYYKIPNAGNIRSSISSDGSYLYFTSQGKFLWRLTTSTITAATPTLASVTLPSTSTSTPAISANNRIYVGYYGSSSSGVAMVTTSSFSSLTTIYSGGKVQASPIVYSAGSTDYVYFTTNESAGAGYCYSYNGRTISQKWNTSAADGANYTLQGMAACNGYLTFGNDGDYFYIIH